MTGTGTLLDPYVIWNVTDLQNMNLDLTAYYELGQDIDASVTAGWNGGLGFVPVGSFPLPANPFSGHFDGKGFTITGLTINRPLESYVALFGYINTALVQNVQIMSCSIIGDYYVGGLAGYTWQVTVSTIVAQNCSSSGTVQANFRAGGLVGRNEQGKLYRCSSSVDVSSFDPNHGYLYQFGGLVGINYYGDLLECFATGNVTVTKAVGHWMFPSLHHNGGLCGYHDGNMTRCFSTGSLLMTSTAGEDIEEIGGLAGTTEVNGQIIDCYSLGDITCIGGGTQRYIGGLFGQHLQNVTSSYYAGSITASGPNIGGLIGLILPGCVVTNSFWDTQVSGQTTSDGGGTGKTTAEMKEIATFFDSAWDIEHSTSDLAGGYPFLSWQAGVSSVWLIFGAVVVPPLKPTVMTLPATGVT